MFKRTVSILVGMACLMALAQTGISEVNSVAGLANPINNNGISARAVGMGSTFVGVADDSSALFWNPAGLAGLSTNQLAFHHNTWLAGISQETAVMALPMGALGGYAISGNYVDYGTFAGHDNTGARVNDYNVSRFGFGVGGGKEVVSGISVGGGLKASSQVIERRGFTDFSGDMGVLWSPRKNIRMGLAYCNLGTSVEGFSQASILRLGGSYRLDPVASNLLLLSLSGSYEPDGVNAVQAGIEDILFNMLSLRAGYGYTLSDNHIDGLRGLSAGVGMMWHGITLDYAYLPFGELGNSQRISLICQYGGAR